MSSCFKTYPLSLSLDVGSFPLTELDEECVLAMKVDSEEKHLVAGDSAGYIAVFDIGTYCTTAEVGVIGYRG